MQVKYQNANPRRGAQSYYVKFDDREGQATNVVLVDAGEGLDVTEDLEEGEYLSAILLTHAHADHYYSLHENIEHGADVLASPATAEELRANYQDARQQGYEEVDEGDLQEVLENIVEVESWHPIVGDEVKVRPVPAGHSPGASGFVLRFNDGHREGNILMTGDFTFENFAGNPGLPKEYPFEIGAMFLNASTNRENDLEEALGTVLGYAEQNREVVVTTSAANGVKFAYNLGKVLERAGDTSTVKVVGSVAKLYENLGHDVPNVGSVPEYKDASNIIAPGTICITAPEKPKVGSSGNFVRALDEETGVVVRFGNKEALDTEKKSHSYGYTPHPTDEDLEALVDAAVPQNVVIEHGIHDRYKDDLRDAFVWATPNKQEHTIYDREWQEPPWMQRTDTVRDVLEAKNRSKADSLPEVGRQDSELEEEGVDIARVFDARSEVKIQREETEDERRAMLEEEVEQVVDRMKQEVDEFSRFAQEATDTIEQAANTIDAGQPIQAKVIDTDDEILLKVKRDIDAEHGEEIEITVI